MIKGLTPRLLEVGKIKIGGKGEKRKTQGGKDFRPPVKYDSFMITTTERGPGGVDGDLITDSETMAILGKNPRSIPITFPFDDVDMNFHTAYQYYADRKMFCKSDGEKAEREGKPYKCQAEKCPDFVAGKCKISGILSCHIYGSPYVDGIYRFRTHGWNSVTGILAALIKYKQEAGGILQGLPFNLIFVKKSTAHGNVGAVSVQRGVDIQAFRRLAIDEKKARAELNINMAEYEEGIRAGGFNDDIDDPGEVQDEYYPEMIDDDEIPEQGEPPEKEKPGMTAEEAGENLLIEKGPVKPDPKIAQKEKEVTL